jgi:hypothetical protein
MNCNKQIIELSLCSLKKHLPEIENENFCNTDYLYNLYINHHSKLDYDSSPLEFITTHHSEYYSITFMCISHINDGFLYITETCFNFKTDENTIIFTFDVNFEHTNYLKEVLLKTIDYSYINDINRTTINMNVLQHNIIFMSCIKSYFEDVEHRKETMNLLCQYLKKCGYILMTGIITSNIYDGFKFNGSNYVKIL